MVDLETLHVSCCSRLLGSTVVNGLARHTCVNAVAAWYVQR